MLRFTILGFLFGTTAGMLNLFPAIAQQYFGLNPAQIGLIMLLSAVVIIVAGPAFGWLADHGSRRLVLMIRGFANIISSVMYLVFPSFFGVGGVQAGRRHGQGGVPAGLGLGDGRGGRRATPPAGAGDGSYRRG